MLDDLTIRSFRGICDLELNDLSVVNIFVGTNGAGKTSILEALGIIANPADGNWLASLGGWRDLPPLAAGSDYSVRTLFPDLDLLNEPNFEFHADGKKYSLEIRPLLQEIQTFEVPTKSEISSTSSSSSTVSSMPSDTLPGLALVYQTPTHSHTTDITLITNGFQTRRESTILESNQKATTSLPPEKLGCFYIHARRATSPGETTNALTRLFQIKSDEPFLRAMRKIDSRVERIVPGTLNKQPIVLVDIGLPRLIPMNVLGDGFCRVSLILTGITTRGPNLLIIDEIDSGLHSSVMEDFWISLKVLFKTFPIQVFCATHNEEMLVKTLTAFKSDPEVLRIFRIDRKKEHEVTAQKYTYESFESAVRSGFDVR